MKIGIFGSEQDAQSTALASILAQKGAKAFIIEADALNQGQDVMFDGRRFFYRGIGLDDVGCIFLRYIMSTLPPAFESEDEYHLFRDWFIDYMWRRERFGFQLSSLLALGLRGVPVVNPPEHGSVVQMKPFQLAAAHAVGLEIPDTLITNAPARVRAFRERHRAVIYKPSMGGGLARLLDEEAMARIDAITAAPVTFQERVQGPSIRVTMVGDRVASAVRLPSESLDYRADPEYTSGRQVYEPVEIPAGIVAKCRALMAHTGLVFTGIDFIERPDGALVFLEANSSPMYLDIEMKTGVPITGLLAEHLLRVANAPRSGAPVPARPPLAPSSFIPYALPFAPERTVGGEGPLQIHTSPRAGR